MEAITSEPAVVAAARSGDRPWWRGLGRPVAAGAVLVAAVSASPLALVAINFGNTGGGG
jgi:hypothetical protein